MPGGAERRRPRRGALPRPTCPLYARPTPYCLSIYLLCRDWPWSAMPSCVPLALALSPPPRRPGQSIVVIGDLLRQQMQKKRLASGSCIKKWLETTWLADPTRTLAPSAGPPDLPPSDCKADRPNPALRCAPSQPLAVECVSTRPPRRQATPHPCSHAVARQGRAAAGPPGVPQ